MANWVKCTRKADKTAIFVNVDIAMSIRWSESDHATIVAYAGGDIDLVKVLERPEDILKGRDR
jgi:hypothetical protein